MVIFLHFKGSLRNLYIIFWLYSCPTILDSFQVQPIFLPPQLDVLFCLKFNNPLAPIVDVHILLVVGHTLEHGWHIRSDDLKENWQRSYFQRSHQLSIPSQLGVGFSFLTRCCNMDCLNPVQRLYRQPELLWGRECSQGSWPTEKILFGSALPYFCRLCLSVPSCVIFFI